MPPIAGHDQQTDLGDIGISVRHGLQADLHLRQGRPRDGIIGEVKDSDGCWILRRADRPNGYYLPSLEEARSALEERLGGKLDWGEEDEGENGLGQGEP